MKKKFILSAFFESNPIFNFIAKCNLSFCVKHWYKVHYYCSSCVGACSGGLTVPVFMGNKNILWMIWFYPFVKIMGLHTVTDTQLDTLIPAYPVIIKILVHFQCFILLSSSIFQQQMASLNTIKDIPKSIISLLWPHSSAKM